MMDAAEAATSILLVFFGGAILLAIYAALYGGNVGAITDGIGTLAGPVMVIAILVFIALAIFNTVSGR